MEDEFFQSKVLALIDYCLEYQQDFPKQALFQLIERLYANTSEQELERAVASGIWKAERTFGIIRHFSFTNTNQVRDLVERFSAHDKTFSKKSRDFLTHLVSLIPQVYRKMYKLVYGGKESATTEESFDRAKVSACQSFLVEMNSFLCGFIAVQKETIDFLQKTENRDVFSKLLDLYNLIDQTPIEQMSKKAKLSIAFLFITWAERMVEPDELGSFCGILIEDCIKKSVKAPQLLVNFSLLVDLNACFDFLSLINSKITEFSGMDVTLLETAAMNIESLVVDSSIPKDQLSQLKAVFPERPNEYLQLILGECNGNVELAVSTILDSGSVLETRKNVFDGDEFDVFTNGAIPKDLVIKGKKEFEFDPSDLEHQKRFMREYEDEYDDTWDTEAITVEETPEDTSELEQKLVPLYIKDKAVFGIDQRKSAARKHILDSLKLTHEQLEGWFKMFDRNPRKESIISSYADVNYVNEPSNEPAVTSGSSNTKKPNRKKGHARKMTKMNAFMNKEH